MPARPGVELSDPGRCRNCGALLTGEFCASCGQAADVRIPSLWAVIGDFLDDFYSFDSRLWRSLIPLLTRPGWLTAEYLRGRRIRYVPPLRMYLVLSLLFFLLASILNNDVVVNGTLDGGREMPADVRSELEQSLADEGIDVPGEFSCDFDALDQIVAPGPFRDRLEQSCQRIVDDGGTALMREFIGNLPIMLFVFIPFAAGYMKVLFPLARRRYVEHLIFLFHTQSFFFLNAIVIVLASTVEEAISILRVPAILLIVAAVIYQITYPYYALRRVYGDGRLLTLLKYLLLFLGYSVFLTLTLFTGFAYTALTI